MLSNGPPELPGLTAASNWIIPESVRPFAELESAVEPGDHPRGQRTDEAERVADGECLVADLRARAEHGRHDHRRQPARRQHGDVVGRVRRRDGCGRRGPVSEGDLDHGGALDDVKCGQDVALGVDDDPGAEVLGAAGPSPLGLDDHEPGPDGVVGRDCGRRLRLQLRYRRTDLLVDDGVDVVRGEGRSPGNAQVGGVEAQRQRPGPPRRARATTVPKARPGAEVRRGEGGVSGPAPSAGGGVAGSCSAFLRPSLTTATVHLSSPL